MLLVSLLPLNLTSTGGLDVDGETQLDELVVAGVPTFSNDVTFTGVNAVWDKSDNALEFAENAAAKFGEDADLEIYHATHSYIKNKDRTAEIRIEAETIRIGNVASTETYIKGEENGEVILYHDNVAKLNTNIGGITVTGGVNASGVVTASSFSGDGSALTGIAATDHVSTFDLVVAGISTFNDDVRILAGGLDVTGVVTATSFVGSGALLTGIVGSQWQKTDVDINTVDKVGVGTTSPQAFLEIHVGTAVTVVDVRGSEGQLFSVTNNLTDGSIFSVNDVSGIPSIDVDADGTIQTALHGAGELVGIGTTNPTSKLDIVGDVQVVGVVTATSFSVMDHQFIYIKRNGSCIHI